MEEILYEVIELFDSEMDTPKPYGIFHICSVILTAITTFLLCRFSGSANRRHEKAVLLTFALICITLEIYKQICFTFSAENGVISGSYQWYAFPFQFCSMPMYVSLICACVRSEALHDSLTTFLATFGMIAGVLVLASPGDVFIPEIGINFQTMIHHGGQTAVGLYLLIKGSACKNLRSLLGGIITFITAVLIALTLNLTMYPLIGGAHEFNMFFISPHYTSTLPVYSSIQPAVPYPVFLILYIFPFVTAAGLIYALRTALPHLIASRKALREKSK